MVLYRSLKYSILIPCSSTYSLFHIMLIDIYILIYPIRPCILGNSHGLKSDNPLFERTASSTSLTKAEKRSLRRVEVELCVRLELGEWLVEIGWVLSVAGVVSIESPLAQSKTELTERRGQVIQELELVLYGLCSRN